jgi:mannitol-1-phosphate 5-dehydrogenase
MTATGKRFVGFGFGAIQSALFLYEARRGGQFRAAGFTIAEVDKDLVRALRASAGRYTINIAHPDGIEHAEISGVELLDPTAAPDRAQLLDAIVAADELCTALPSVAFYTRGGEASVASLLAEGLRRRPADQPALIYAAENHHHAAQTLTQALRQTLPANHPAKFQVLQTVIGKMCGIITDPDQIARLRLAPLTPTTPRAVLVEPFNHILISRITLPGVHSGIPAFVEKDDLLPFAEAKLFGHNAIHALLGYLAERRGLTTMAQAAQHPDLLAIARRAFIEESGAALCRKYANTGEVLFTPAGFSAYADDLLERMVNPNLHDPVARVIRDPRRKLGYDDRIFGAMRLALAYDITPACLAQGAAAAVRLLAREQALTVDQPEALDHLLHQTWSDATDGLAPRLVALTWEALCAPSPDR